MFHDPHISDHTYSAQAGSTHLARPDYRHRAVPNFWTLRSRGENESALDCETAVALACFVGPVFEAAKSWCGLLSALERRGFRLVFEGNELTLIQYETGVSLCTCASLGYKFSSLKARLGKPKIDSGSLRLTPHTFAAA